MIVFGLAQSDLDYITAKYQLTCNKNGAPVSFNYRIYLYGKGVGTVEDVMSGSDDEDGVLVDGWYEHFVKVSHNYLSNEWVESRQRNYYSVKSPHGSSHCNFDLSPFDLSKRN